jgi:hypothetical protein
MTLDEKFGEKSGMTKERRYEQVLKQIAEGSDAVPAHAWRYLAHTTLGEFGVSSEYREDERHPWPED